jgi:hypothetical protein
MAGGFSTLPGSALPEANDTFGLRKPVSQWRTSCRFPEFAGAPFGGRSGFVSGAVPCPYKGEVEIAVRIAETIIALLRFCMVVLRAQETHTPELDFVPTPEMTSRTVGS